MDIINLPYPMFETTEQEKKLLRKAELHIADTSKDMLWLCNALSEVSTYTENARLKNKISASIHGRSSLLYHLNITVESEIEARYIRRVWITKLLNYKG